MLVAKAAPPAPPVAAPPRAPRRAYAPFYAAAIVAALAGAGGMLAQAALADGLEVAFGSPAPAVVGCVLALLLGLGIGAELARARPTLRARPIVSGGEALVALAAMELVLPYVWSPLSRAPVPLRALVGGPLLVVPSIVTGAVLPLLARGAARDASGSRRLAALFSVGLAGGAGGSAVAACVYAPYAGLAAAIPIAALITAVAGAGAGVLAWRYKPASARPPVSTSAAADGPRALAMGSIAHGFLSGAALLLFAHVVRVVTGADGTDGAASIAASLTGTLLGFAAGAAHARPFLVHHQRTAAIRAMAACGLAVAMAAAVIACLPAGARIVAGFSHAPSDLAVGRVLLAIVATAFPSAWIGASFQLLAPHLTRHAIAHGAARSAGAGVAGATLGAAFAGIILLPLVGSQRALAAIAIGFSALAIGMGWAGRATKGIAATTCASLLVLALSPRWNLAAAAFGADDRGGGVTWIREGVASGVAATTAGSGDMGMNGRVLGDDPRARERDERVATLARTFAGHLTNVTAADDLGIASALLAAPWQRVTVPRVPSAISPHLTPALRAVAEDSRAVPADSRGTDPLLRVRGAEDAVIVTVWSACGVGCTRSLASRVQSALASGGVGLFVVHDPDAIALAALLRAVRATFPHAGIARPSARAVIVVGGPAPLEYPALIATDTAVESCADAIERARDASAAALDACASAAPLPALVSR